MGLFVGFFFSHTVGKKTWEQQLDFQIMVVAVKFVFKKKIDTVGTIGQKAITLRLYACGSNKN